MDDNPSPFVLGDELGLWVDFANTDRWCLGCGRGRSDRYGVILYAVGDGPAREDRIIEDRCIGCTVALLRAL